VTSVAAPAAPPSAPPTPPGKKLKVLISVDMEGIDGVATFKVQALPSGREYTEYRHVMTDEVNAAVAGARAAGATDVLVVDSHGDTQNLDLAELDPGAQLVRGTPRPMYMMQGIDESFDAVVFVGYHAKEGSPASMSHAFGYADLKLNGRSASEAWFNAAIAGEFGVPVVFLSGDQTTCEDARRDIGPIETAAVKQSIGYYAATMLPLGEARRLIQEGVRRGVARRAELRPIRLAHPIRMEITYSSTVDAEIASYLPGVERPSGKTIARPAKDMVEAMRFVSALTFMNRMGN
jgi:D-amino peptidase